MKKLNYVQELKKRYSKGNHVVYFYHNGNIYKKTASTAMNTMNKHCFLIHKIHELLFDDALKGVEIFEHYGVKDTWVKVESISYFVLTYDESLIYAKKDELEIDFYINSVVVRATKK